MHCHRRWSYPFQRLSVFCFLFFNVFVVWYKCHNQWDQSGYFCWGSGKYFGQNQIISVCRPIKKIWRCCADKAKSVTVFHQRKPADVKAGKTLSPYQNIHWLEYLCHNILMLHMYMLFHLALLDKVFSLDNFYQCSFRLRLSSRFQWSMV